MTRVAWLLNLDADHELRRPLGYQPTQEVLARVAQMQARVVGLVRPGDVVVGGERVAPDLTGLCWCPTPTALARLLREGVTPAPPPPFEVVRRVNHRLFSFELGATLAGAAWVADEQGLARALRERSPTGHWVLKRPYSIAGGGRRVLRGGALAAHDERWVRASLREDGLIVEPWVELVGELAIHGYLHPDGRVVLGQVCQQEVDAHGAWRATVRAAEVAEGDARAMNESGRTAAAALSAAGYFGPFGVDAFRYRLDGGVALNARSEINARYTMGWAIGMGDQRPDVAG